MLMRAFFSAFNRYQNAVVTDFDYYGTADQRSYHNDGPLTSPVAAVISSDDTGGNIMSHILKTSNIAPKRHQSFSATAQSAYDTMTLTPHATLTTLQPDSRNFDSCSCHRHHRYHCHHVRCSNHHHHQQQQQQQQTLADDYDVNKLYQTSLRHQSFVDPGLVTSADRPNNVSRVVCCGTVRKVEPVSLRRPVCDSL
jgi:hypothetical protein